MLPAGAHGATAGASRCTSAVPINICCVQCVRQHGSGAGSDGETHLRSLALQLCDLRFYSCTRHKPQLPNPKPQPPNPKPQPQTSPTLSPGICKPVDAKRKLATCMPQPRDAGMSALADALLHSPKLCTSTTPPLSPPEPIEAAIITTTTTTQNGQRASASATAADTGQATRLSEVSDVPRERPAHALCTPHPTP